MKKYIAQIILFLLTVIFITIYASAQQPRSIGSEKHPTLEPCEKDGRVVSYSNNCGVGGEGCIDNNCPKGTFPLQ
jgi:hypothetical protein